MSYNNKSWLYKKYSHLFLNIKGKEITKNEEEFLVNFFDLSNANGSKLIYYMAIFRLKRGYPKFIVFYFISKSFKKEFKEQAKLASVHKIFAKKMLFDAIKAYCKISD